jgi:hypothetical protein
VVEETHVESSLLEAGYHEGATFYELKAFVDTVQGVGDGSSSGGGGASGSLTAAVTCEDGLAAVAIGVAAERSIQLKKEVHVKDVMSEARASWAKKKSPGAPLSAASESGSESKRQKT